MHNLLKYILSGITGGLVVVVFITLFDNKSENGYVNTPNTSLVSLEKSNKSFSSDYNFVQSAKKSTGSVVHIYSEESEEQLRKRRENRRNKDPFFDIFGFDDFFGNNFYRPKNGTGSGVVYSADGIIITNNHVVGFADKITVTDDKGKKYQAKKIGVDESTDLAVIKILGSEKFEPIILGNSDKVQVGEWVLAVGNPFGYLTSTVTAGIVSAKGRNLDISQSQKTIQDFIQTDAAINPGNSGGALVNLEGELIGINTAIATPTGVFAGYSFAIPSNIVRKVVRDIIETGGNIERTNLGVGGYDVTPDLIEEFELKLKAPSGFYIDEVEPQSAAQLGGLLPGDVIISINDAPVENYDDIEKNMKLSKVGDKIFLKINRSGKLITLPIKLKKML